MSATFDGTTYLPLFDQRRLQRQYQRVFDLMQDGEWYTLSEIAELVGCPEASVSARIRDMRNAKFGGHTVNRRRAGDWTEGKHEYQLILKGQSNGRNDQQNAGSQAVSQH